MITVPLTDDEVVATTVLSGSAWLRPLMTVDTADATDLAKAVGRGLRSLALRGLRLTSKSDLPFTAAVVPQAAPDVMAYVVDADNRIVPLAQRVEYFARSEGRPAVLIASLPLGVVVIATNSDIDLESGVQRVVEAGAAAKLGVAIVTTDGTGLRTGYVVNDGAVRPIGPGGESCRSATTPPHTWQEALQTLIA